MLEFLFALSWWFFIFALAFGVVFIAVFLRFLIQDIKSTELPKRSS